MTNCQITADQCNKSFAINLIVLTMTSLYGWFWILKTSKHLCIFAGTLVGGAPFCIELSFKKGIIHFVGKRKKKCLVKGELEGSISWNVVPTIHINTYLFSCGLLHLSTTGFCLGIPYCTPAEKMAELWDWTQDIFMFSMSLLKTVSNFKIAAIWTCKYLSPKYQITSVTLLHYFWATLTSNLQTF